MDESLLRSSSSSAARDSNNVGGDGSTVGGVRSCRDVRERHPNTFRACVLFWVFLVGVSLGALTYLAHNGAFEKVRRDVRIVNGTVIEPNTGMAFPIKLERGLDGSTRQLRLVGLFLKVKHVPEIEASLRVFNFAMYLDRDQARKYLKRWKAGDVPNPKSSDHAEFDEFMNVLTSGKISAYINYRMLMSPPGTFMRDHWISDLVVLWKGWCQGEEPDHGEAHTKLLMKGFDDWNPQDNHEPKNHDDFSFEWVNRPPPSTNSRGGNGNEYSGGPTFFIYNKKERPEVKDYLMGRGLVAHELRENGNMPVNLLSTLFDEAYD